MLNSIKKAEVLIVDNNSSDNTESEVAKFIQNANYEIRYINEKDKAFLLQEIQL